MNPEEIARLMCEYEGDEGYNYDEKSEEFNELLEIVCIKSNLKGYNPYDNSWVCVREDDPEFEEICATYCPPDDPENWRGYTRPAHMPYYGNEGHTRFDYDGPCE